MKKISTFLLLSLFIGQIHAQLLYSDPKPIVDEQSAGALTDSRLIDWDHDGDPDILYGMNYSSSWGNTLLYLQLNDGNGGFSEPEFVGEDYYGLVGFEDAYGKRYKFDVNDDGAEELVVFYDGSINRSEELFVITFGGVILSSHQLTASDYGVKFNPEEFYVFDYDNDGDNDISVQYDSDPGAGVVVTDGWLVSDGDFEFSSVDVRTETPFVGNMDMDNDGDLDFIYDSGLVEITQSLMVRENLGANVFDQPIELLAEFSGPYRFEDLDGDGLTDIGGNTGNYSPNYSASFAWTKNLGGFSVGALQSYPFITNVPYPNIYRWNLVDFNQDSYKDIIYTNATNATDSIHIFLNNGAGGFVNQSVGFEREIYDLCDAELADMDGDGSIDALGFARDLISNCHLTWQEDINNGLNNESHCLKNYTPSNLNMIGDFNGDGYKDVYCPHNANYSVYLENAFSAYLYWNDGAGNLQLPVDANKLEPQDVDASLTSFNGTKSCIGDFNNNGRDEIAMLAYDLTSTLDYEARLILYEYNDNTMLFDSIGDVPLFSSIFPEIVYTLFNFSSDDFNGDGFADFSILTNNYDQDYNSTENDFIYFINDGQSNFTKFSIPVSHEYYSFHFYFDQLSIFDVNSDGHDDYIYPFEGDTYITQIASDGTNTSAIFIEGVETVMYGIIGETTEGYPILLDNNYVVHTPDTNGDYTEVQYFPDLTSVQVSRPDPNGHIELITEDQKILRYVDGAFVVNNTEIAIAPYFISHTIYNYNMGNYALHDVDGDGYQDMLWVGRLDWDPFLNNQILFWYKNLTDQGCTDITACNFNNAAFIDDGSCCYDLCGCTDPNACNYDSTAQCDNGTCIAAGCTNAEACNYNPSAGCDDGSCITNENLTITVESFGNELNDFGYSIALDASTDLETSIIYGNVQYTDSTIINQFNCVPYNCYKVLLTVYDDFDANAGINVTVEDGQNNILLEDSYTLSNYNIEYNQDSISINLVGPAELAVICICPEGSVAGCMNEEALNFDPLATCQDNTCQFAFTGRVFFDENENGIFDGSDYGLPFQELTIYPDNITLITNDQGFYSTNLPFGFYILGHTSSTNYPYYTTASSYNITSGLQSNQTHNFGITFEVPNFNICVDVYPTWYICNTFVNFNICFRNTGNLPISGVLTFNHDPLYSSYYEVTPIDSVAGNTLYFSYENLMPGEMFFYDVELYTPTVDFLGEMLLNNVNVTGYNGGQLVATAYKTQVIEHACSYDPNDKQGDPLGYSEAHFVEDGTSIEYLIRFQNTGTAPAYNVTITDQIDENLDMSTIELVANSHSVMASFNEETRQVEFFFNEIMLPDSFSNEAGSHGLVSYRIKLKDPLQAGTEVNNTAYIYFDFNPPIVTNTTLHTIFDCEQYEAAILSTSNNDCDQPAQQLSADVLWTEEYSWLVDGEMFSNEPQIIITTSGSHEVQLFVQNPLCGMRNTTASIIVDQPTIVSILADQWSICPGESTTLSASIPGEQYTWYLNGEVISNSISADVSEAGVVELITTIGNCTANTSNTVLVLEAPNAAPISQSGNVLSTTSNVGWTYQWYLNNLAIDNATSNSYEIEESGSYTVIADNGDCQTEISVNATYIGVENTNSDQLIAYPNPASDLYYIQWPAALVGKEMVVYNAGGQIVHQTKILHTKTTLSLNEWASGIYSIRILNDSEFNTIRLTVVND